MVDLIVIKLLVLAPFLGCTAVQGITFSVISVYQGSRIDQSRVMVLAIAV